MTFLGWLSDPFKGLSDLQLGDQKVTLNHLEIIHVQFPRETLVKTVDPRAWILGKTWGPPWPMKVSSSGREARTAYVVKERYHLDQALTGKKWPWVEIDENPFFFPAVLAILWVIP